MVWSENFHFKQFPGQTRRERRAFDAGEPRAQISPHPRRVGEIAPSSSCRRDCPTEIIGAIVLVLDPKLIGAVVIDLVLVAHRRRCYRSRSRSWPKAHQRYRSRRLDLIAPMILSSRSHRRLSFPEVFDHSFFLPLSVWPNLYEECGRFKQISVSLKCIYWNFCNKICLWFWFITFSLWSLIFLLLLWWCGWWWKITFSECYQTHENIFYKNFHNTTKHLKIFSFSKNNISGKYFTWTKHSLSTRLFRLLEAKTHFLRAKNESQAFGNFKTHFLKKVVFWNAKNWDKTCVKALLINITIRNARNDPNYSHLTNHKIHWKLKRQT